MDLPREFAIGGVRIAPNLILAPMSGITDSIFRRTIKEANPGAVGLVVSELTSIEGLCRREPKSLRMLKLDPVEQPAAVQLFGADPARMAEAARLAADHGAAIVDINCGCPVPKVVTRGGGADLMRQAGRLAQIVEAVRRAVCVPVTVKIRAGWDDRSRNAVEVARAVEAAGAAMIAVHGRTRLQLYTGECDWNLIAEVKAAVGIPVVGSGDIVAPADALRRMRETGVDGVMIGRGTLTNPWIFRQVRDLCEGRLPVPPEPSEVWRLVTHLVERLAAELHPKAALGKSRGLVCRMTRGLPHGAVFRETVTRAPSLEAVLALLRTRAAASSISAAA